MHVGRAEQLVIEEAHGARPSVVSNPDMQAAIARASHEPHVGGVLGEGVLALNTASHDPHLKVWPFFRVACWRGTHGQQPFLKAVRCGDLYI